MASPLQGGQDQGPVQVEAAASPLEGVLGGVVANDQVGGTVLLLLVADAGLGIAAGDQTRITGAAGDNGLVGKAAGGYSWLYRIGQLA
jgi:hypothetical protein